MNNGDFAAAHLTRIHERIGKAADQAGRKVESITLIGASKQQPASRIADFNVAGLLHVGENYLQEALKKQEQLQSNAIDWHYIGRIQSRKCKHIAQHFTWIHGVDRLSVAERLAKANQASTPLNLLLQINIDDEPSKAGVATTEVPDLCERIHQLPGVRLRGFMVLPKASDTMAEQRRPFAVARELLEHCNQRDGLAMDHLSMGMSGDLEAAILEGSTMLRIGTDLFGPRSA